MENLTINKSITGESAMQVADYLLEKHGYSNVRLCCKEDILEIIIDGNNHKIYYKEGDVIKVLTREEIKETVCTTVRSCEEHHCKLRLPEGWKLSRFGFLMQGTTGWLLDEMGLYILEDGRRVEEKDATYNGKDLRIGDADKWKGLAKILGYTLLVKPSERKNIYKTSDFLGKPSLRC